MTDQEVEARILKLESDVADIRVEHAKVQAKQEFLDPTIAGLKLSVDNLSAVMAKAQGAIWLLGLVGTAVGVVGTWIAEHFSGKAGGG